MKILTFNSSASASVRLGQYAETVVCSLQFLVSIWSLLCIGSWMHCSANDTS